MGKCPYCGAEVELKSAYEVYHTANSRDWEICWGGVIILDVAALLGVIRIKVFL